MLEQFLQLPAATLFFLFVLIGLPLGASILFITVKTLYVSTKFVLTFSRKSDV